MAGHVDSADGQLTDSQTPSDDEILDTATDGLEDYDTPAEDIEVDSAETGGQRHRPPPLRLATTIGILTVLTLAGLAGWLGYRTYEWRQTAQQDELFVQTARQGALNLTTIDWQHADADVARIIDSATGQFRDDFSARAQPFLDVVKKAQSKSEGTVTEAALESAAGDNAQVLVAMSVTTTMANQPEPPRSWRMRISVQRVGADQAKVSNVAFVP